MRRSILWAFVGVVGCVDETVGLLPATAPSPDRGPPGLRDAGPPDGSVDGGAMDLGGPDLGPDLGSFDAGMPRRDASFELPAPDPIYVHSDRVLFEYDVESDSTRRIGTFETAGTVTDLAIDRTGRMVAVSGAFLFDVEPTSARMRLLSQMLTGAIGLTFLPDGSLVAAGGSQLVEVDVDDGRILRVVAAAPDYVTAGDVVALPDGMLYWSAIRVGTTSGEHLLRVDPESGDVTDLGRLPVTGVWGLAYADGMLYGFTASGRRLTIELGPDGLNVETDIVQGSWWGATTNPVLWD